MLWKHLGNGTNCCYNDGEHINLEIKFKFNPVKIPRLPQDSAVCISASDLFVVFSTKLWTFQSFIQEDLIDTSDSNHRIATVAAYRVVSNQ